MSDIKIFLWNCSQMKALGPHWWLANIATSNGLVPPRNNSLLSQCWPRSMSPYGVTKLQWFKRKSQLGLLQISGIAAYLLLTGHVTRVRIWLKFILQWGHNERDGVSNHRRLDCLLNHLFWRRSKKILRPRVTGHCAGNSPVTGEFPAQSSSNAENVSIWWRHHEQFRQHHDRIGNTQELILMGNDSWMPWCW